MAKIIGILVLAGAGAIFVAASAYRVNEYQQAIITEFGKPIGEPKTEAGLYWRTPFIQTVRRFEKRLLEHDGEATQIPTLDKKFIFIDTFARWRIVEPLTFYKSVRDELTAKRRLDDIIDSETRDVISSHPLIEAVRKSNRELTEDAEILSINAETANTPSTEGQPEEPGASANEEPQQIELGREKLTRMILVNSQEKLTRFGIELVDVEIKSINYVPDVQEKVFERMVSERSRIADRYRAEGQRVASETQGRIQRERNRILSEAYRRAETLKGEAEAEATRIYGEAYGEDPEFYTFWRSLEIYRSALNNNVTLMIGTDSDFFKFLKSAKIAE